MDRPEPWLESNATFALSSWQICQGARGSAVTLTEERPGPDFPPPGQAKHNRIPRRRLRSVNIPRPDFAGGIALASEV